MSEERGRWEGALASAKEALVAAKAAAALERVEAEAAAAEEAARLRGALDAALAEAAAKMNAQELDHARLVTKLEIRQVRGAGGGARRRVGEVGRCRRLGRRGGSARRS